MGSHRLRRLPGQLARRNPFSGTLLPGRVPLLKIGSGRPTVPFPHPWNYTRPLRILETFFWNADADSGAARHNRYMDIPGFAPVLVTRDPLLIRAISTDTGDKPGQFDRDTLPSTGIARATGADTLLFANGATWKRQKQLSAPPFSRGTLFQPDQFHEFEQTFRRTVLDRLELVRQNIARTGKPMRVALEPEIKAIMLEMLVNNFFGAEVPCDDIRNIYVPALDCVIDHIVRDTVINKLGIPLHRIPSFSERINAAKKGRAQFETLTNLALTGRSAGRGLWKQFRSDAPDDALRSNIRVFLAGALEATTSFAGWAIAHLARNPAAQEKLHAEIGDVSVYSPQTLAQAKYLGHVLDETLRLTPSLYFHPRRATVDTCVETSPGQQMHIPQGTHILLDIWHANRHEDHWGTAVTGHRAIDFVPERWENFRDNPKSKELLHFGFGHGPRFCPGKNLGQLEVALVVGACVKLFQFRAVNATNEAKAGVSTKPADGVLVELSPRNRVSVADAVTVPSTPNAGLPTRSTDVGQCPFHAQHRNH